MIKVMNMVPLVNITPSIARLDGDRERESDEVELLLSSAGATNGPESVRFEVSAKPGGEVGTLAIFEVERADLEAAIANACNRGQRRNWRVRS
jgi:hypothetical protein